MQPKKQKKGVTTNRTKRKRTEPDPEVSDVYQHIRGMLEASDANVSCSKIYLTKGKISENQNQLQNFTITVTEFKNSVSGLNIKSDVAEERISELKDWSGKNIYERERKKGQNILKEPLVKLRC